MTNVIPFRPRTTIEFPDDNSAIEHVPYTCDFYQTGVSALLFACLPLSEGHAIEQFMRDAFSALGVECSFYTEHVGENLIIDVCGPAGVCLKAAVLVSKYRDAAETRNTAANSNVPEQRKTFG
jgi:hypothetical protein